MTRALLNLVPLIWLAAGPLLAQDARPARHAELFAQVAERLATFKNQPAITIRDFNLLRQDFDALYQRVQRDSEVLVHRRGKQVTLESDGLGVFREAPVLPPENKRGEHWYFRSVLLEVVPQHLFVFAVRIKGDHTIRVRRVTLTFHDGTTRVFDNWLNEENGNGRAFSRRSFGLDLPAWLESEGPLARPLKSIEILGSAQDEGHAARLLFQFVVPDPLDHPYKPALRLLDTLRAEWFVALPDPAQLEGFTQDLNKLARSLDLDPDSGSGRSTRP